MIPGVTVNDLDAAVTEICKEHGFGDHHIVSISQCIGLRYKEKPASTIIKPNNTGVLE
jgi:Xaa-Pro aminopeptidase